METLPPGALLRDPRSPDVLDIRVVSSDEKFLVVSIGRDTRRYKRSESLLRRWLLPARTAVAIVPMAKHEVVRTGVVIGLRGEPDSVDPWTYVVDTDAGTEEVPEQHVRVLRIESEEALGENDAAFASLFRALDQRDSWLLFIKSDPIFDGLHRDPRWAAVLRRMNLSE